MPKSVPANSPTLTPQGIHLVPASEAALAGARSNANFANILYRIAAVAAALFLVVTIF
jgi:preprotein translocase subunit SecG